jgi:hypothetical protein
MKKAEKKSDLFFYNKNAEVRKITPFSCSKPSSEEHPGPPFVLQLTRVRLSLKRNFGFSPENQIVDVPTVGSWKKPEKELTKGISLLGKGINVRSKPGASRSHSNLWAGVRPSWDQHRS